MSAQFHSVFFCLFVCLCDVQAATGSVKAARILKDWSTYLPKFWQLVPPSEAYTPEASSKPLDEPVPAMAA